VFDRKEPDVRDVADASSVSGHRLIMVLEEIALRGPVSLSQLEDGLDIPRVSIWRAARSLRERGWVRLQYGGKFLELSSHANNIFSRAHIAVPECDEYAPIFDMVLASKLFHVSVGLLAGGRYEMIETSQRGEPDNRPISLVYDSGPLAAQLACNRGEVHRHLVNFLARATVDEQRMIRAGDHLRQLEELSQEGVVWSEEKSAVAIPWRFQTGSCGAIEIQLRVHTRKSRMALLEMAKTLKGLSVPQDEMKDLLETPIRKQIKR